MARFKTVEATVVGLKYEPLQRANLIVLEVALGVQLHCLCPFEHLLEEGDKVALEIEVPLKLEKVRSLWTTCKRFSWA